MNLLLNTGSIAPKLGNNAALLLKLLPFFQQYHAVRLLSPRGISPSENQITEYNGVPLIWGAAQRNGVQGLCDSAAAKLIDRNGYSDYIGAKRLKAAVDDLLKRDPVDAIISTMEPFPAADAAARIHCNKRILYLMDPPACISSGQSTPYRNRRLKKILASHNVILTTPFISAALIGNGFNQFEERIVPVGFPLIERHDLRANTTDSRIHLLFCGWLYSDIRSPKYFLDILSRLDERFVVTFMGRECEKLAERFDVHTKAQLITLPQQPYEVALQAMADADIMINIGNSVPVHMPSKTLEYINTGKPFVNFYKMDDCPTLYYTKRYPLCLNMSEKDTNLDAAALRFIDFCVENKGKTVDRDYIEREYEDCTPQYIAQKILDALGE